MAAYIDLHEQALKLFERAEQQRRIEAKAALEAFSRTMIELDIGLDELLIFLHSAGFRGSSEDEQTSTSKRSARIKVEAAYVNVVTGETWSGRGRPPRWIVESESMGVNRNAYLNDSTRRGPSC